MSKLIAKTFLVNSLKQSDINDMYKIFSNYYDNTNEDLFLSDLKNKDTVFLLLDKRTKDIKGFSTIKNIMIDLEGREVRGVFSGDTIIEKEYWGQGALGVAFLKYLFWQKIKKPLQPLYWFLICKGYKTYLLMANNFSEHYPRFEKETPDNDRHLIDSFSKSLFNEYYCEKSGVISAQKMKGIEKDCLKKEVCPISKDLIEKNKRVAFFINKNPDWSIGDELSCIAKMTFSMPFMYQLKFLKKSLLKLIQKRPQIHNEKKAI
jgi:hypothetical protein